MGYYKLIRKERDGKAVRGTLCSVEHRYSGSAGEYKEYLTPICSTIENSDYLIPALVYKVQVTQSPRFKRLLPILSQVPGRSGIRVHRGSRPEHSKGCILVSPDNEKLLTELWLKAQNDHETTYLDSVTRSTDVKETELLARVRFATVAAAVNIRMHDVSKQAADKAAFLAQKDLPGGKTTLKSYIWAEELDTYDQAHQG